MGVVSLAGYEHDAYFAVLDQLDAITVLPVYYRQNAATTVDALGTPGGFSRSHVVCTG